MSNAEKSKVEVSINGVSGVVDSGVTLLEAAAEIGSGVGHLCFGNAICNTCRLEVVSGAESLSEKSQKEKVSLNYHLSFDDDIRLGCQTRIVGPGPVVLQAPFPFNVIRPPDRKAAE